MILKALVKKEIRKSFHKSALGIAWHIVVPALQLVIFFTVYGAINDQKDLLATITALFLWFLFSNAVQPSIQSILSNHGLITNLKIPAYLLPASSLIMSLIFTSLFLLSSVVFIIFYKTEISSGMILVPLVVMLFILFTYGLSLFLAIGNVFFRDIGKLWNSFNFLLFLTAPILYPIKILPVPFSSLAYFNPITQFIDAIRLCARSDFSTALYTTSWHMLLILSAVSMLGGLFVFKVSNKNLIANL